MWSKEEKKKNIIYVVHWFFEDPDVAPECERYEIFTDYDEAVEEYLRCIPVLYPDYNEIYKLETTYTIEDINNLYSFEDYFNFFKENLPATPIDRVDGDYLNEREQKYLRELYKCYVILRDKKSENIECYCQKITSSIVDEIIDHIKLYNKLRPGNLEDKKSQYAAVLADELKKGCCNNFYVFGNNFTRICDGIIIDVCYTFSLNPEEENEEHEFYTDYNNVLEEYLNGESGSQTEMYKLATKYTLEDIDNLNSLGIHPYVQKLYNIPIDKIAGCYLNKQELRYFKELYNCYVILRDKKSESIEYYCQKITTFIIADIVEYNKVYNKLQPVNLEENISQFTIELAEKLKKGYCSNFYRFGENFTIICDDILSYACLSLFPDSLYRDENEK